MITTIIGRGHSGTRIASKMLLDSGVFMGDKLNSSYDKVSPFILYKSVQYINKLVKYKGNAEWDYSYLIENEPDDTFKSLVDKYLKDVLTHNGNKGWKIPETTMIYPWLIKLYPDIRYIIWWRDPRDAAVSRHKSDKLEYWNIGNDARDTYEESAYSYKYQYDMINCVPRPKYSFDIRYEDFCADPKPIVKDLSKFLDIELKVPEVFTRSVGKWKKKRKFQFNFLNKIIEELGYDI